MTDAENGAPEESSMSPDTGGTVPAQASAERGPADADAGADTSGTGGDAGTDPTDRDADSDSTDGESTDGESADAGAPAAAGPGGDAADRAAAVAALAERVRSVGRSGPNAASASAAASAPEDGAAPATPADGTGTDRVVTDEQRAQALRATAEVLGAGGAPAELAAAAVSVFGDGAAEQLREDPWAVLSLPGVRPEHADGFARGLLGPAAGPGDPRRAQALVGWLLEQAALRGHSALEIGEVTAGLERLGVPDSAAAVQAAVLDGGAMPFQEELTGAEAHAAGGDDEDEPPTRTLLALERLALAEESLADGLVRLMSTFVPAEDQEEPAEEAVTEAVTEAAAEAADDEAADEAPEEADGTEADAETGADAAPQAPAAPGPAAWEAAAEASPSSSAAALVRAAAGSALVLHTGGEAARAEPAALLATATGLGLRAWAATWTDHARDAFTALTPLADTPAPAPVATLAELLAGAAAPAGPPTARSRSTCWSCWTPRCWMSSWPPPCWSRWPTAPDWCSAATRASCGPPVPAGSSPTCSPPRSARPSPPAPRTSARSASSSPASASASSSRSRHRTRRWSS